MNSLSIRATEIIRVKEADVRAKSPSLPRVLNIIRKDYQSLSVPPLTAAINISTIYFHSGLV